MAIEIDYRGYVVSFGENSNSWSCYELGTGFSDENLLSLKGRIDKFLLDLRKKESVVVYEIFRSKDFDVSLNESKITEYISATVDKNYKSDKYFVSDHTVAVAAKRRGNGKITRQHMRLRNLVHFGQESEAAVKEVNRLGKIAQDAVAAFEAAFKAMPSVALAEIDALVKLSGKDPTGGFRVTGKE